MNKRGGYLIALKQIRERCGLSQKQLALKLKLAPSAVCQYESGKREPSIEILIKLSEIFGCTIDELVKGEKK